MEDKEQLQREERERYHRIDRVIDKAEADADDSPGADDQRSRPHSESSDDE